MVIIFLQIVLIKINLKSLLKVPIIIPLKTLKMMVNKINKIQIMRKLKRFIQIV